MKLRCQPADNLTVDREQECHHLLLTNKTTSQADGIELPGAVIGPVSLFETFLLLQLSVIAFAPNTELNF